MYGITGSERRFREHRSKGWELVERRLYPVGYDAHIAESAVKSKMKSCGLHASAQDGSSGTTEAWWRDDLPLVTSLDGLISWSMSQ
jgi:hypothetical protein